MNPAALAAALSGDIDNAIAASTPGGIQAQERAGQATLVANSAQLPKKIMGRDITREMLAAAWGIVFHGDVDNLFVRVTLPAGWKLEATDHSLWSRLLDANGCERAGIFYKAAFYDRNAHMSLTNRYGYETIYESDGPDSDIHTVVKDRKTGALLLQTQKCGRQAFEQRNALDDICRAHLAQRFPDWKNPLAYWAD